MTLTANRRFGIVLLNSDRNQVKNNLLSLNGGLDWGAGVGSFASNNNRFVTNVVIDNTTDGGAAAPKSGGFLLHGILGGRNGSSDNVINANTIRRNGASDGNLVAGEFSAGVRLNGASNGNTVKNNTVTGNIQAGIMVNGDNNSIKDNFVFRTLGNGDGIGNGIILGGNSLNNTIKGNAVSVSVGTDLADTADAVCIANTWKNNTWVSKDPACIQ